ncbi:MAG: pyridoxal phosphate-dependent aminotransferase [Pseudomonadota bacterium]
MALLNQIISTIKPSATLALGQKVLEMKAAGEDVIGLAGGEPNFPTPKFICDAAIQAIQAGQTKYTAVDGTPELKQAIIDKFSKDHGLACKPHNIIVGTGAKQLLYNAFMVTLNPGDEVIVPAPYWVSYPPMVQCAQGHSVFVPTSEAAGFKLRPRALSKVITKKTKWLCLNSPSNPTGAVYSVDELKALGEVLAQYPHVHVISDDIYEKLIFDGQSFATIAQVCPHLQDRVLTINGVSKAYAMTGWRIGYAAGPVGLIKAMKTLQSQSTSSANSIAQAASAAALNGDQSFLTSWVQKYQSRRDLMMRNMADIPGLKVCKPSGAFYLWVNCQGLLGKKTPAGTALETDMDVADYLLDSVKVAVMPGSAFGMGPYLRFSIAVSQENLDKAAERFRGAVARLSS